MMNEWEHQSIGASYLGPNGSGPGSLVQCKSFLPRVVHIRNYNFYFLFLFPDWRSNVGARENVLRKTDERNKVKKKSAARYL